MKMGMIRRVLIRLKARSYLMTATNKLLRSYTKSRARKRRREVGGACQSLKWNFRIWSASIYHTCAICKGRSLTRELFLTSEHRALSRSNWTVRATGLPIPAPPWDFALMLRRVLRGLSTQLERTKSKEHSLTLSKNPLHNNFASLSFQSRLRTLWRLLKK